MSSRPMLTGEVDNRDEVIITLRAENQSLRDELTMARAELLRIRNSNDRAVDSLRRQLLPLYTALRGVFGEIEILGFTDGPEPQQNGGGMDTRTAGVWETWKRKLGGKQAEFIQAMLEHGPMTPLQLKVTTHSGTSTVSDVLLKLRNLNLVDKDGGRYSLKQLS